MTGKDVHAMSRSELDDYITGLGGLPAPPYASPIEDTCRWLVATFMIWCCKGADDLDYAKDFAASLLLHTNSDSSSRLRPYIGEALCREITDAEMAAGKVDGFAPPAHLADFWYPGVKDLL